MESNARIDMSLDAIIKLNKKQVKIEKKDVLQSTSAAFTGTPTRSFNRQAKGAERGSQGFTGGRGRGRGRGRGQIAGSRGGKRTSYTVPNKLRKTSTQNTRVTGARGRAQQKRKLTSLNRGKNAISKARQTIYDSVRNKQRQNKDNVLNTRRGINANAYKSTAVSTTVSVSGGRRKLSRPGFGVMQADIVAQENAQKQQYIALKYSSGTAITGQRKGNLKRRWQQRKQQVAPPIVNEPGHVFTIRVKNNLTSTTDIRPAQLSNQRTHSVANRILRNTLQQPMRERRQANRSRARGVRRGSGRQGQVRLLTNTIHKLRQQVATLQGSNSSSNYQARGRGRGIGQRRQNNVRGRGRGRGRNKNNAVAGNNTTTRTVRW